MDPRQSARTNRHPTTPTQLELPGIAGIPRKRHNLFFAVMPPAHIAHQVALVARAARKTNRLEQRPFEFHRFHVSLLGFGARAELPLALVNAARRTAEKISVRRFQASFDRVLSLTGRSKIPRSHPLVLKPTDAKDFSCLRNALVNAIGLEPTTTFLPHMTLLYDETIVHEHPIRPISWTVEEFALIHSLIKEPKQPKRPYSILGRWKLR